MSRTSAEARQSDEWPREIQLIVRRIARHKSRPVKSFISNEARALMEQYSQNRSVSPELLLQILVKRIQLRRRNNKLH